MGLRIRHWNNMEGLVLGCHHARHDRIRVLSMPIDPQPFGCCELQYRKDRLITESTVMQAGVRSPMTAPRILAAVEKPRGET